MDDKYFKSPMAQMTDTEIKIIIEKDGDAKCDIEYLTVQDMINRYKDILTEEQIKKLKYETLDKNRRTTSTNLGDRKLGWKKK